MVAIRSLKEIVSLTRRAARNIRQSLDDIAQELINQRQLQQQPLLSRVPVHNRSNVKNPFLLRKIQGGQLRYQSTFVKPVWRQNYKRPSIVKSINRLGGNNHGFFPSTLYSNFVKTNSRNYSQYTNFTHQCVQNLNQNIRAMLLQTKDEFIKSRRSGLSMNHHLNYATEVFEMARTESSFSNAISNCYLEFPLQMKSNIPSMTFIDDDIIEDLQLDFQLYKSNYQETLHEIKLIKEQFGELPISKDSNVIRIHFANCDREKVESLLRDIGVTKGVIHESLSQVPDMELFTGTDIIDSSESVSDNSVDSDILTDEYFPMMNSIQSIVII